MILYFDTETTGLCPGRIIQLSYIMQDEEKITAKNFFFEVDYIEPSAVAVHGFTVEKLKELAQGKTFSYNLEEIDDDFRRADLIVAHNAKFDIGFMIAEFCYVERQFRYNECLDTMKFFTPYMKLMRAGGKGYKYPKLTELEEYCGLYTYDVTMRTKDLFNVFLFSNHDARYDTTAMFMAFNLKKEEIKELEEIALKYLPKCG